MCEIPDDLQAKARRKAERLERRARSAVRSVWGLPREGKFAQPCHTITVHAGGTYGPFISANHDHDSSGCADRKLSGPAPACAAFAEPMRKALYEASGWRTPTP